MKAYFYALYMLRARVVITLTILHFIRLFSAVQLSIVIAKLFFPLRLAQRQQERTLFYVVCVIFLCFGRAGKVNESRVYMLFAIY